MRLRKHIKFEVKKISLESVKFCQEINDDVQLDLKNNTLIALKPPSAERVNAKSQYILHRKWPIACISCTHQKLYKFDEVVMIIFVSGKNRPLLLAKGVHWCLIFMCTLHLWPGTWDTSQRKFMIFHQLSQKLIYLDWLDFYVYVIYIQTYVDHFFILEIIYNFFAGKKLPNLEPHPPVAMLWIVNCINLWLWLIDRWNINDFFICRVPSCFKLWAYWFIHCIDDRPTNVYCLDCVKLLQYHCIFHSIL